MILDAHALVPRPLVALIGGSAIAVLAAVLLAGPVTGNLQAPPVSVPTSPARPIVDPDTISRLDVAGSVVGHTATVWRAAFSPDGSRLATPSDDGTVRVWDAATLALMTVLRGHEGWVLDAAFTPDGQGVVSASADATVRRWTLPSGAARTIHLAAGAASVAVAPSGIIAAGGVDGSVWLIADDDVRTLATHDSIVRSVALTADGRHLAAASADGTVSIWDTTGSARVATWQDPGEPLAVAFSPDGRTLAVGSDRAVTLLDAQTLTPGRTLAADSGTWSLAFTLDGRLLLAGTGHGELLAWEVESGAPRLSQHAHDGTVRGVAISPAGDALATTGDDGALVLWRIAAGPVANPE